MAWNDDPAVRDLAAYAKSRGCIMGVFYGVKSDGETFTVATYGKTVKLCKAAKIAGDQLFEMVMQSQWPTFPENEPE